MEYHLPHVVNHRLKCAMTYQLMVYWLLQLKIYQALVIRNSSKSIKSQTDYQIKKLIAWFVRQSSSRMMMIRFVRESKQEMSWKECCMEWNRSWKALSKNCQSAMPTEKLWWTWSQSNFNGSKATKLLPNLKLKKERKSLKKSSTQ